VQYIAEYAGHEVAQRAGTGNSNSPTAKPVGRKADNQMIKLDEMQKFSKDNMDNALKSFGAFSKTGQAIATEMADYSKKSFEDGTKAMEKLFGVKSLDKAIEIQADYVKAAYEDFVAQATKISELYVGFAKETFKPFEGYVNNVAK
jgi:hypothetical protein